MRCYIIVRSFLFFQFSLFISLSAHGSEVVKKGDEIDLLTTKSGRVYEGVVIREVLPQSLRIMHKDGAANIPAHELPQYAQIFSVVEDPATQIPPPTEPPTNNEQVEQWTPSSVEDVMDCSLIVNINEAVNEDGVEGSGGASAFLVNHGKTTYIYSNVHNFDGTRKFEIKDRHGNRYTDFVSVEVAADGYGFLHERKWGGDILRIRLSNFRAKALTIEPEVLSAAHSKGRKISITGNTKAQGVVTRHDGIINEIDQYGVIRQTSLAEAGNSGSPIIDLETLRVLGIFTWGKFDSDRVNEMEYIWLRDNNKDTLGAGVSLADIKYVPSSFNKIYEQRMKFNDLKKLARILGLMDTLIPAKEGLFLNKNAIVQGEYNVGDIFSESGDNPILHELVNLSNWLKRKSESNIGISNQDMLKQYIKSFEYCYEQVASQRENLKFPKDLTFFMKCRVKNTRAQDICHAYQQGLLKAIDGYHRLRGTGGKALPLANRFRLPSYTDGLSALGIGEE